MSVFRVVPLWILWSALGGRLDVPPAVRALPAAHVTESRPGRLVIDLLPVDLPAHAMHHDILQPPVSRVELLATGSVYGFRVEVVDSAGRLLPQELIHHFNVIDPGARELFLPISHRLLAAGQETGEEKVPWLLFGHPVRAGETLIVSAMLHNPTAVSYHGVRVRLVLDYTPTGRPWPFFKAYTWQMDVSFPVGDKSFDLPPGRSERWYEGSPAIPGTMVAIGGHLHEYGVALEFRDVTARKVIWRAKPETDSASHIVRIPVGKLYSITRLGAHVEPGHRYRITVVYENPTGAVIPGGGMGVVGGLFIPDRHTVWPPIDQSDSLFQADLRQALRLVPGAARQVGDPPAPMTMPMSGSLEHTNH
jgi:hypothetical protein